MDLKIFMRLTITLLIILIFFPCVQGEIIDEKFIDKKFGIVIAGNWNSLKNERLNNDYIETWSSWGFLDDKIKSGYGFSIEILYYLSPKFSIGAGLIYIGGSSKKDRVVDFAGDDTTKYHDYLKTRLYAPLFSVRYYIHMDRMDFSLGISESFLFGKASRHHTSISAFRGIAIIENDYYSTGVGFQLFCGISYRLTSLFSYNMEVGYRHFRTGDLVEKDTELAMRTEYIVGTEPPINLDYSGPYISAGLMFKLF